jgi:uncharacterized protein (TIGR03435 family)
VHHRTVALAVPITIVTLHALAIRAQEPDDWQKAAGDKMAFEVASVKPSSGKLVPFPTDYPLTTADEYHPNGGRFRADLPLWRYILFAYKIWPAEEQKQETLAHLPKWITTDSWSIDARATGNPTKDQMRLMVQSLLADRFKLKVHFETREASVQAFTLIQAGKLGPKLRLHADGPPCDDSEAWRSIPGPLGVAGVTFPPFCDSSAVINRPNGMMLVGYRNATMDLIASSLSRLEGLGLGRPIIDKTELSGRYDFTIEWLPESHNPPPSDSPAAPADPIGPTVVQALRDQLGLQLKSTKAPIQVLIVDRVERPSEN